MLLGSKCVGWAKLAVGSWAGRQDGAEGSVTDSLALVQLLVLLGSERVAIGLGVGG